MKFVIFISRNLNCVYESCNKFDQFLCVKFLFSQGDISMWQFYKQSFSNEIDMHWEMGICIKFILNAYLND
jgi:hypothetical protein